MSFIRPEVREGLLRWRETLSGVGVLALAFWLMADGLGARFWIGLLLAVLGTGLVLTGVPRARARGHGEGAGVIEIDERQITYFGPISGGAMALEELSRISAGPGRRWVLTSDRGELMTIPMDAPGHDALFDAFAALPGLPAGRIASVVQSDVPKRTVIWEKPHVPSG